MNVTKCTFPTTPKQTNVYMQFMSYFCMLFFLNILFFVSALCCVVMDMSLSNKLN